MPGAMPRRISGWPKRALSLAMMKSAIIASSQPPPSAKPLTAAIHGLRVALTRSRVHPAKKSSAKKSAAGFSAISLMSAPAAKALSPLPVITAQSWAGSASKAAKACVRSARTCEESALSAWGRLSVNRVTGP
jgi:hypothetical protein